MFGEPMFDTIKILCYRLKHGVLLIHKLKGGVVCHN